MRRLRTVLVGGLLALVLLAGCGGDPAPVGAPGGADGLAGDIAVREAQINQVPARPGDAAFPAGGNAVLTFSAANTGDVTDRLLGITAPVAASTEYVGDQQIPGGRSVVSGYIAAPENGVVTAFVQIKGLREELVPGRTYPVTFVFERGGSVTLQMPARIPVEGRVPTAIPAN